MALGKGTEAVGDVAALGRLAGDAGKLGTEAKKLGAEAKKLGAKAKAGAAAAVIAGGLLGALVLASVGMIFYGIYRGLEAQMAPSAAALALGGAVLGALLLAAALAVRKVLPKGRKDPEISPEG